MNIGKLFFSSLFIWLVHHGGAGESKMSDLQLVGVGPCTSAPCLNAGSCVAALQSSPIYICQCLHGFTGQNCELGIDECASSPCINGACVDNIGSFRCMCFPGYKGRLCDAEVDLCASSPCKNGGTCLQKGPGSFHCTCRSGYRGITCETDIDECLSLSPCQHGGSCTQGAPGTYVCACQQGYTGTDCEKVLNICEPNPCQHGGHCVPEAGGQRFKCDCKPGYQGDTCSQVADVCANSPCGKGTCRKVDAETYACEDCPNCTDDKRNPCNSQPCVNNGTCITNSQGTFVCICPQAFTGVSCETETKSCDTTLCNNGGTCRTNTSGNPECFCPEGFRGSQCELMPDNCSERPCHNNGSCRKTNSPQGFQCQCLPHYFGSTCQFVNITRNSTMESSLDGLIIFAGSMNPTILLTILGILFGLGAILGISAFIIRKKHIRRPEDFCFSLPTAFYQHFNSTGSIASSGRFQNGSILDYNEFLHAPTAFRY